MPIEQARGKAREWLDLLARDIDPAVYAEEQRRRAAQHQLQKNANRFGAVAAEYIARRLSKQRRGARLPEFLNPARFLRWLDDEKPTFVQSNN